MGSTDGNLLIGATPENTFSVWDTETGERLARFTEHSTLVIALLFSPYGEFLTSVDWDGGLRKWETGKLTTNESRSIITSIQVWDVAKSVPQSPAIRGHTSVCGAVKFSPDSTLLASDSFDRTILLWDIKPYLSSIDTTSELSQ